MKEALHDRIIWAILGAGAITLLLAPWLGADTTFTFDGVWEGLSIFAAVALIVALNTANDYMKDKQFAELYSQIRDEYCTVTRGKSGATQSVSVEELVVGDCVLLEAGARVSADCILVEGSDVVVNESYYHGADHKAPKRPGNAETISSNPDCFILSQSLVVQGVGKAIVCSVGEHSRRATVAAKRLGITDEQTPLQERLTNLGSHFSVYGLYAAVAILAALLLNWLIVVSASENATFEGSIKKILYAPITALMIVVVAVPEGLPLSIQISLAYSTKQMKKNNILVKRLESMEVMGTVQEIVTGKTGTLTQEDMHVAEWYAMRQAVKNRLKNTMCAYNSGFPQRWQDLVKDAIVMNTDARIEMGDEATYEPVGQGTEVAMLKFLQDNQQPIQQLFKDRKEGKVLFTIPHSSARARMTSVVELTDSPDYVRVVVKGAPEILLSKCSRTFNTEGGIDPLDEGEKEAIIEQFLNKEWVNYSVGTDGKGHGNAYRSILYAYQDIPKADFESRKAETHGFASEEDKAILENELTLVGIFALENPLREKVAHAIRVANQGHLKVRMVSGDSEGTAKAVALQAGILDAKDLNRPNAVISGAQFREAVGQVGSASHKDGGQSVVLGNPAAFAQMANEVKVIYRATAEDKLALVVGLKNWSDKESPRGRNVAVTGEGVNDESALNMADVGFAMGKSGCDIAKEASAIILTDDNFSNSVRTAMWGRNIYQNIRKFLQFQATVNLSCCLVVFLGALTLGNSPFGVVQLLWINLVMDIFGALALATEPPRTKCLKYEPVKDGDAVMTREMWMQIFGVGIWITLVTMIVLWAGQPLLDTIPYNYGQPVGTQTEPYDPVKRVHTFAFNLFMAMHLFNEVCCRKVDSEDLNMFDKFFNNWLFTLILFGQAFAQWAFSAVGPAMLFMGTSALDSVEWATIVIFGLTVLVVSPLLKLAPEKARAKIPALIDETANMDDSQAMKLFATAKGDKVADTADGPQ